MAKVTIEKATSKTVINTIHVDVDLPDEAKYYMNNDNGIFFPQGTILFAIIPKYEGDKSFFLYQITKGRQRFTDFHPSDCKNEDFLDYKGLRNDALDILTNVNTEFEEISKEVFDEQRINLLNYYLI